MLMKLNSRCKGLLEVTSHGGPQHGEASATSSPQESNLKLWEPQPLHVSYLHRNPRDYLELRHVWAELLSLTADTDFDPTIALLMSYVIEVKTTSLVMRMDDVYSAGSSIICRIEALRLSASKRNVELYEEVDRSINVYGIDETLVVGKKH